MYSFRASDAQEPTRAFASSEIAADELDGAVLDGALDEAALLEALFPPPPHPAARPAKVITATARMAVILFLTSCMFILPPCSCHPRLSGFPPSFIPCDKNGKPPDIVKIFTVDMINIGQVVRAFDIDEGI